MRQRFSYYLATFFFLSFLFWSVSMSFNLTPVADHWAIGMKCVESHLIWAVVTTLLQLGINSCVQCQPSGKQFIVYKCEITCPALEQDAAFGVQRWWIGHYTQIKAFWPECMNVEFGSVNSNVLNSFFFHAWRVESFVVLKSQPQCRTDV